MEKVAERYTIQNPEIFPSATTAFILAFSVIMLNTDLHNPSIKPERRMTLDGFQRNNRSIGENGADMPAEFLAEERKKKKFKQEREEMMSVMEQLIRKRRGKASTAERSNVDYVAPVDVVKPMMDVTWEPLLLEYDISSVGILYRRENYCCLSERLCIRTRTPGCGLKTEFEGGTKRSITRMKQTSDGSQHSDDGPNIFSMVDDFNMDASIYGESWRISLQNAVVTEIIK